MDTRDTVLAERVGETPVELYGGKSILPLQTFTKKGVSMFHVKHHLRYLPYLGAKTNSFWARLGSINYSKVARRMGKKRWQWEYKKNTKKGQEFFPF